MPAIVRVGAQEGDEGRGKIVDHLAERTDVVIRCQGRCLARHVATISNTTPRGGLIATGVVRSQKVDVHETMPGWQEEVSAARRCGDLPRPSREESTRVSGMLEVPIDFISVCAERYDTIALRWLIRVRNPIRLPLLGVGEPYFWQEEGLCPASISIGFAP